MYLQRFEDKTFGIQVSTVNKSPIVKNLNSAAGLFNPRIICAGTEGGQSDVGPDFAPRAFLFPL